MSDKLKKSLALLTALGITVSGVTELVTHLMQAFPANAKLHAYCAAALTFLGLAAAVQRSIVGPGATTSTVTTTVTTPAISDKTPAESPSARTKQ